MGITIHYRGRLPDLRLIEPLEDLLLDLVLGIGGEVDLWRTSSRRAAHGVVRGLLINVEPGQETVSLLFGPDGRIVPLHAISDAEQGTLGESTWCSVKTQYGSPIGHAALVELLTIVRDRFIPDLEVSDEAGYWTHRDPAKLIKAMGTLARAIDALAGALESSPLSAEAAEDPEIVAARVERVARTLQQAAHGVEPPAPDALVAAADWPAFEAEWRRLVQESEARARRVQRSIEERLLLGDSAEQALDAALAPDDPNAPKPGDADDRPSPPSWRAEDDPEDDTADAWKTETDPETFEPRPKRRARDSLLERATKLYLELMALARSSGSQASIDLSRHAGDLLRHAGELCGGLAQALPLPPPYDFDDNQRGLAAAQLKRALRGAAFLRAGFSLLPATPEPNAVVRFHSEVGEIQSEIVDRLRETRPLPPL